MTKQRMEEAAPVSKEAGDDVDELVRKTERDAKRLDRVEPAAEVGGAKIEFGALPDLGPS